MTKPIRDKAPFPLADTRFAIKQRKAVPHEFVLDAIAPLSPARVASSLIRTAVRYIRSDPRYDDLLRRPL